MRFLPFLLLLALLAASTNAVPQAMASMGKDLVVIGKVGNITSQSFVLQMERGRVTIPRTKIKNQNIHSGDTIEIAVSQEELQLLLQTAK